MADIDKAEVARALNELLTIAKVAMPDDLFAADPRIVRAQALLASLQPTVASGGVVRVPIVPKSKPDHLDEIIAMIEGEPKAD